MNHTNILVPQTEQRFTETATEILNGAGYTTDAQPQAGQEFQMEKMRHQYCAIIRYSPARVFSETSAVSLYLRLKELEQKEGLIPLVVVSSEVSASLRKELRTANLRTEVLDIRDLLHMAAKNRELYDKLAALLPYSVSSLMLQSPASSPVSDQSTTGGNSSNNYADPIGYSRTDPPYSSGTTNKRGSGSSGFGFPPFSDTISRDDPYHITGNHGTGKSDSLPHRVQMLMDSDSRELQQKLEQWEGGKKTPSSEYEKLCTRVLNRLFSLDDLSLWLEQAKSNDDLYRFDLICKIKQDNHKDFWETVERHFHSKYIIFEFKNYSGEVTQMEVTTTARYLYTKALRTVAIIVSPKGFSAHAEKAARGALREEGKLILSLTNADLIEMLQEQDKGNDPSEYLNSKKLDTLLINLEK